MEYKVSDKASKFIAKSIQQHYIDGQWVGQDERGIDIINPATEEKIGAVAIASGEEVDAAVASARRAFEGKAWRKMRPAQRERLLLGMADILEREQDTLAEILTLENGKLYSHAQSEIRGAANTFRYYAGWSTKLEGETLDISLRQAPGMQNFAFTKKEPLGVVAAIVPWNFPLSIAAWKLAPILAAGCTVVLKPSEVTPLSTLYMASLFEEVGFPKGVVNIITGDGTTGAALTQHRGIDKITFTGSSQVGKTIGKAAMGNLTDVSLELGGKSPSIVFDDANMEDAARGIALGIFRNGGQVCVAGSRVYIQRKSFDNLVADIAAHGKKMKMAHGFDETSDLGPLVSESHLKKVQWHVAKGIEGGAELVTGGQWPSGKGYYMEPTIFTNPDNDQMIISEEIFGPVLVAVPFDDIDDALTKANDSQYGLSSTVWTKDISKAMKCVDAIDAGWVFVNAPARSDPNMPLGGNKQSGIGRELGKEGVYNYLKTKSVNIVY